MKIRNEPLGLHLYDRKSGYHILLDEIKIEPKKYSISPRTVSIAITDKCDLNCLNCYIEKKGNILSEDEIMRWCKELDMLGTLDIAIGGGEPTLHPELLSICENIWENTDLGLSLTTHGYNLTYELIDNIKDYLSIIRISLDGNNSSHYERRNRNIDELESIFKYLKNRIKFGLNILINSNTINCLDSYLQYAKKVGAEEILLLPMVIDNIIVLSKEEWSILNNWVNNNYRKIPLRISNHSREFIKCPFLFQDAYSNNSYAYISADKKWKKSSFNVTGINMSKYESIEELIINSKDG